MQFTLRQLFVCTALFAMAFAIIATAIPYWKGTSKPANVFVFLFVFFGPFAGCAMMGLAIGLLTRTSERWEERSAVLGILFFALYMVYGALWVR